MTHLVRCRAERTGRVCNAFVARVPWPYRVRLIGHSGDAAPGSHVSSCGTCGQLHEITPHIDRNGLHDVA